MARPAAAAREGWFIQAAGRVWGPYTDQRLSDFVEEGRVAAETLVATRPAGPFDAAVRHPRLARLFGVESAEPEPSAPEPAEPVALTAPVATEPRASYGLGQARALLVWASLRSLRAERFEQFLAAHGPLVRLGADLWLVRVRGGGAASLRNALTRRFEAADALLVVEAPLDQAAWFNLDPEADRTARQLWMER